MRKLLCLVGVLAFCHNAIAQVSFLPSAQFAAGSSPEAVVTEDINGDGELDLMIVNWSSHNVSVLTGTGTGAFSAPVNFPVGSFPYDIITADFNNDGKVDLAVANSISNDVSVLLGNGLGSFSAAVNLPVGLSPLSVVSDDFNGDGKSDIATGNQNGNSVSVLLGNGLGSFSAAATFTTGINPVEMSSGDLNGDGKIDLVTTNYVANTVSILFGNGLGSFSAPVHLPAGLQPISAGCNDLNGDGMADLAVVNYGSDNVSIFLNNGGGIFSAPVNFSVGNEPYCVAQDDFDNDGKIDLAIANYGSNNVTLLLGNGLGSFSAPVNFPVASGPLSVIQGDFNGDGLLDLATANTGSNNASILINNSIPGCANSSQISDSLCQGDVYTFFGSTYTATGVYSHVIPNGNILGCDSTVVLILVVSPLPVVGCTTAITSICTGDPLTLSGSGAVSYVWSGSVLNGVLFYPSGSATYTVTGTDAHGCTNTSVVSVGMNPLPSVTASVSEGTLCKGSSTILSGFGALNYSWTGGVLNAIPFTPMSSSTYTVTGVDANNCSNTSTVTITVIPSPVPVITQTGLVLSTTSFVSYQWHLNGNILPGATNQTYTINQSGSYHVSVQATNGCIGISNAIVCNMVGLEPDIVSSSIVVYPNPCTDLLFIKGLKPHIIRLFAVSGELLQEYKETDQIDISTYSEGFYFISLYDKDNRKLLTRKVTKF